MKVKIGDKFNKWTIISLKEITERYDKIWNCICDCGETSSVRQGDLKSGKSSKCLKCSAKETSKRLHKDIKGKNFGEWTILERVGTN